MRFGYRPFSAAQRYRAAHGFAGHSQCGRGEALLLARCCLGALQAHERQDRRDRSQLGYSGGEQQSLTAGHCQLMMGPISRVHSLPRYIFINQFFAARNEQTVMV